MSKEEEVEAGVGSPIINGSGFGPSLSAMYIQISSDLQDFYGRNIDLSAESSDDENEEEQQFSNNYHQ